MQEFSLCISGKDTSMIKRVAVINDDLSGLGKCSLTAAIPVLSVMGVQACPLPTAVLTNQTGYDSYYCTDFTDKIDHYTGRMAKTWSYPGCDQYRISRQRRSGGKILNFCARSSEPLPLCSLSIRSWEIPVSNMTFSLPDSNSRCRSLYPMPM